MPTSAILSLTSILIRHPHVQNSDKKGFSILVDPTLALKETDGHGNAGYHTKQAAEESFRPSCGPDGPHSPFQHPARCGKALGPCISNECWNAVRGPSIVRRPGPKHASPSSRLLFVLQGRLDLCGYGVPAYAGWPIQSGGYRSKPSYSRRTSAPVCNLQVSPYTRLVLGLTVLFTTFLGHRPLRMLAASCSTITLGRVKATSE